MRIVYDDARVDKAITALHDFMTWKLDIKSIVSEDDWMPRVQQKELKNQLARFFARDKLRIGNTVTHAYNIGNNRQYPVYYEAKNELQQCCAININFGLYGEVYVSLEDYDGNRISNFYKLTAYDIVIDG